MEYKFDASCQVFLSLTDRSVLDKISFTTMRASGNPTLRNSTNAFCFSTPFSNGDNSIGTQRRRCSYRCGWCGHHGPWTHTEQRWPLAILRTAADFSSNIGHSTSGNTPELTLYYVMGRTIRSTRGKANTIKDGAFGVIYECPWPKMLGRSQHSISL